MHLCKDQIFCCSEAVAVKWVSEDNMAADSCGAQAAVAVRKLRANAGILLKVFHPSATAAHRRAMPRLRGSILQAPSQAPSPSSAPPGVSVQRSRSRTFMRPVRTCVKLTQPVIQKKNHRRVLAESNCSQFHHFYNHHRCPVLQNCLSPTPLAGLPLAAIPLAISSTTFTTTTGSPLYLGNFTSSPSPPLLQRLSWKNRDAHANPFSLRFSWVWLPAQLSGSRGSNNF